MSERTVSMGDFNMDAMNNITRFKAKEPTHPHGRPGYTARCPIETMKPQRLQLSRKAGFNLQRASLALNGLPAVRVARPSKWGNPFSVEDFGRAQAVAYYRAILAAAEVAPCWRKWKARLNPTELRGKNLACWCKPGQPCHADVLLELANA